MNKKAKMRMERQGVGTQWGEREGVKRKVENVDRCRTVGK
jgi:hypothetical protein